MTQPKDESKSRTGQDGATDPNDLPSMSVLMLDWYDSHRRRLPWRSDPGVAADPYHVWLSEIMLQQTTVATVGPYFRDFLEKWPSVMDMAAADLDDILHAWAGLGYYARARNLHKCARVVAEEHDGVFPDTEEGLIALPGIGRYTASAVAAIAFGRRAVVVDGNVERVMARLFDIDVPLPVSKPELTDLADSCTPDERAGDYAQSVMDLGATICTPRSPKCTICPVISLCKGRDRAADLPRKMPKKVKPTRIGTAFWVERPDGAILFRRRPEKGLLGGMMEVPSTEWKDRATLATDENGAPDPPVPLKSEKNMPGIVRHTFTHFHLELTLVKGLVAGMPDPGPSGRWVMPDQMGDLALPTVMKKVVELALSSVGR